ncbi:hypothetical protein [Streptococcus saliviloxodontae]|uniref:Phage protein n=1 Tax=Streptococcus saliviloxodontae TaxID=1349416 RepID=A0ABS2PLB2_9STRE|nr:hypothetical protein [Streptococcus saliviloxodontae]MBM7635578.1 hypothetical protein [Streptococcus saliviloxodontae]
MYEVMYLKINEKVISLFSFLKNNATRVMKKNKHYLFIYFQPTEEKLVNFSFKGITLTTKEQYSENDLLSKGWGLARDNDIATVGAELLNILSDIEKEYLTQSRRGNAIAINGKVKEWLSYGLNDRRDISDFVKLFFINGYDFDDLIQFYSTLAKDMRLNAYFLELTKRFYKEVEFV